MPAERLSNHRTLLAGLMGLKAATVVAEQQLELIERCAQLLKDEPSTLVRFLRYFMQVAENSALPVLQQALERAQDGEEKIMQTIAEFLEGRGYQRGRREGREEGREEAREAMQAVLTRLLVSRFGELSTTHRTRLEEANRVALEAWLSRVLDASSLDDVFSSH